MNEDAASKLFKCKAQSIRLKLTQRREVRGYVSAKSRPADAAMNLVTDQFVPKTGWRLFCGFVESLPLPDPIPRQSTILYLLRVTELDIAEIALAGVPRWVASVKAWEREIREMKGTPMGDYIRRRGITAKQLAGPTEEEAIRKLRNVLTAIAERCPFQCFHMAWEV